MKLPTISKKVAVYTLLLSLTAQCGSAVLVPLLDFIISSEAALYHFVLGQIVTALVAPPICYWCSLQYHGLQVAKDTLALRNKELAAAKAKAENAADIKTRFLAIMSHEIRTPLNGVLGMAQLLVRRPLESQDKILADTLLESGQSLMTLLNDLLDLSRAEAGHLEIAPVRANLAAELRQIQLLFAPLAAEKGLEFEVVLDPGIPETLTFDPVRVRQCASNLISNAIKFTKEGSVRVCCRFRRPGALSISVTDTGPGLTAEEQTRVFEAFTQASATTAQHHGGSGLGLNICRQLADLMGGEVTLSSSAGAGCVFELVILAEEPEQESATEAGAPASTGLTPERWLNGRNVLVVDDVATNRLVLGTLLERTGARVQLADSGSAALQAHLETPADLILLDLQMPDMDGFETARRIRASQNADVPVIAISAHAHYDDRLGCIDAGMDGLMLKPIELRTLFSEIARIGLASEADRSITLDTNAA
ncbi:MAG: ATP-binding protein [Paracoccaceae bacterium]